MPLLTLVAACLSLVSCTTQLDDLHSRSTRVEDPANTVASGTAAEGTAAEGTAAEGTAAEDSTSTATADLPTDAVGAADAGYLQTDMAGVDSPPTSTATASDTDSNSATSSGVDVTTSATPSDTAASSASDGSAPLDLTPPTLLSSQPMAGANDFQPASDFTLTFDRKVRTSSGNVSLVSDVDGSLVEQLDVNSARISCVGSVVTIDWLQELAYNTSYSLRVDDGAIVSDAAPDVAWRPAEALSFSTDLPPNITLLNVVPAANAVNVDPNTNLVLTFSQPVALGSGNLDLRSADGLVERFGSTSANVVVEGVKLSLDPTLPLDNATVYTLTIGPNAVVSTAGAVFEAAQATTPLSFETASAPPPPLTVAARTPATQATGVELELTLEVVFSSTIRFGQGMWSVFEVESGVLVESASVVDPRISVSANTARFSLSQPLSPATAYYVTLDAGSFESQQGASFGGFATPMAWSFTTRGTPAVCPSDSVNSASGGCYFLSQTLSNWQAARAMCAARGAGWQLAEPRSPGQQLEAEALITTDTWIGGTDIAAEGVWRWESDGVQFWSGGVSGFPTNGAYTRWRDIEPTGGSQNCARLMYVGEVFAWYWADSPCENTYQALCEGPKG